MTSPVIGAYSVVEYPKTVKITDDESTKLSFRPDDDPTKAFDVEYAVADIMISDLVTARPDPFLIAENIKLGVVIFGVTGTYNGPEA